jgi:hypothetical protein
MMLGPKTRGNEGQHASQVFADYPVITSRDCRNPSLAHSMQTLGEAGFVWTRQKMLNTIK